MHISQSWFRRKLRKRRKLPDSKFPLWSSLLSHRNTLNPQFSLHDDHLPHETNMRLTVMKGILHSKKLYRNFWIPKRKPNTSLGFKDKDFQDDLLLALARLRLNGLINYVYMHRIWWWGCQARMLKYSVNDYEDSTMAFVSIGKLKGYLTAMHGLKGRS